MLLFWVKKRATPKGHPLGGLRNKNYFLEQEPHPPKRETKRSNVITPARLAPSPTNPETMP